MTQAELIEHDITQSPIRYSVTDAKIAELSEKYLPLKIDGIDDKAGFDVVHLARMEVKNLRVSVEKTRKNLKAGALEYGRKVDGEAKRITELLQPIEDHLSAEENAVKEEKARIAREAEEDRQAKLRERYESLAVLDYIVLPADVEAMSDEEYESTLAKATSEYKQKVEERKAEEAARKAEQERLDREREELEKQRAEQEAENRRIQSEREKLEAEQREKERQAELERARQEAAEKARIEEQERIAREAEAKRQREEAEAEERARLEALRPDREKLLAVADAVNAIEMPEVSEDARAALDDIEEIVDDAVNRIRDIIKEM